ncbi:MAG: response regulator transcription factor [Gammaproteobacteria bacterium]|nr:response regulator transcription factor [Gammaproteobacteria bacterium]
MKILIADDHALFRQGMIYILSEMNPDVRILQAATSNQAIQIAENDPNLALILMDLWMPDMDGIDAMRVIQIKVPTIPVVILTASESRLDMKQALDAGAMGYVAKSVTASIMTSAIKLVLSGGIYIPPALVNGSRQTGMKESAHIKLTPRQTEVLRLLLDGQSNKQAARFLNLSEATVKAHISAIFKVLNVNNRTQAALAAKRAGF